MEKRNCILCRKPIRDGIIINGRCICSSCESRVILSKANNDFYEYYKDCIKKTIAHGYLKNQYYSVNFYR